MDIPRANTIIINRADQLGLSELIPVAWPSRAIESAGLCIFAGAAGYDAHSAGAAKAFGAEGV